jgi:hypothetical protein
MALRDLWRSRERHGEGRDRDWLSREDWRDEGRYGRERGGVFGASEREYSGAGQQYSGRNWSPESDYFAGRDYSQPFGRSYGQSGYGGYGEGERFERGGRYGYGGGYGYGTGQFRGRGPRGYQRSDERIREDVCERLTDDPQIDASNLEVTVKGGEVTLSGTVNSREDKRRAEECAEDISGVKDVHNGLRISAEQGAGEQRSAQQTTQPGARH